MRGAFFELRKTYFSSAILPGDLPIVSGLASKVERFAGWSKTRVRVFSFKALVVCEDLCGPSWLHQFMVGWDTWKLHIANGSRWPASDLR
jgi:hypothetical protein